MHGEDLPIVNAEEFLRVVKALGGHRYVDGSLHLIHAFAYEAAGPREGLEEGYEWATSLLQSGEVDPNSRDPRLFRSSSSSELHGVLAAFLPAGTHHARERLRSKLSTIDSSPSRTPFDERAEADMFPLLIDAGWQLLPLAKLDHERHKGAILAFGEEIAFESARFEEENALPERIALHELPAFGAAELLESTDAEGDLRYPIPLFSEGNDIYLDYILRGVLKIAKITPI